MNKVLCIIILVISLMMGRSYRYKCNTCYLVFEYGDQGVKICPRDGSFMVPDSDFDEDELCLKNW